MHAKNPVMADSNTMIYPQAILASPTPLSLLVACQFFFGGLPPLSLFGGHTKLCSDELLCSHCRCMPGPFWIAQHLSPFWWHANSSFVARYDYPQMTVLTLQMRLRFAGDTSPPSITARSNSITVSSSGGRRARRHAMLLPRCGPPTQSN
jgi:hypothetical protein